MGKLLSLVLLLATFLAGMAGVVYMSLSGDEVKVPEITGKDFIESEKELASLGLKIKRRAERTSTEKMNTVLEQLPKAGETVKTGQLIFVVVSKAGIESDERPQTLKTDIESDDTEKIEEMISDKPKKPKANTNSNSNTNVKKKADTTRDQIGTDSNSNPDTNSKDDTNSKGADNKKDPEAGPEKKNANTFTGPLPKPKNTPPKPGPAEQKLRNQRP